jgi:hypothetical protein
VLGFVLMRNLPAGGEEVAAPAKALGRWAHDHPDPYLGPGDRACCQRATAHGKPGRCHRIGQIARCALVSGLLGRPDHCAVVDTCVRATGLGQPANKPPPVPATPSTNPRSLCLPDEREPFGFLLRRCVRACLTGCVSDVA